MNRLIAPGLLVRLFAFALLAGASDASLMAQTVLDEEGRLVRFDRDIAPILKARCLECHGPNEAKNDFRVDDVDTLMSYIEPEDHASSTLFVDYLATEDADMRMPPASHGAPLSTAELALIRVWIDEGAVWPEGYALVADPPVAEEPTAQADVVLEDQGEVIDVSRPGEGWLARIWAFQGYLHPAAVHFPIALLLLGGLFVVLGWRWPAIGTQVPLACLWIGAVTAVVASMMGWSFATEQGYGSWDRFDATTEIFWHRWSALTVTAIAVLTAIIAAIAMWRDSPRLNRLWKVGLIVAASLVGLVGHQGGELTYGKTFYQKAFDRLWPPIKEGLTPRSVQSSDERNIASGSDDKSIR